MDPTANLNEQLELAADLTDQFGRGDVDIGQAAALAELVLALHGWISSGGFLPQQWIRPPAPPLPPNSGDRPAAPPECVYNYCPYSDVCREEGCQHRLESKRP